MSATRSSTKAPIPLSAELEDYLQKLLAPLSKSADVNAFLKRLEAQEKRIETLEAQNSAKDTKIVELELKIADIERSSMAVDTRCDDLEQYTRRLSVRVNGLPACKKGEREDVNKIVEDCHRDMKIDYDRSDINRAHRVGPVVTNQQTGKKIQSVIVQFRSWDARCRFYKNRPKFNARGRRFSVALDITKRRYDLLSRARAIAETYPDVSYVFSDLNCNCMLKMENGDFHRFNSQFEFEECLKGLAHVPVMAS